MTSTAHSEDQAGSEGTEGSYWPADESIPLLEDLSVGGLLREAAAEAPERAALIEGVSGERRRWTYAELLAVAERTARALLAGFSPGERVAVWAPNLPEWVFLEFGAAFAGIGLVAVNPAYRPRELRHVLGQSRASGIFLVAEFRGSPMGDFLEEIRSDLPDLREVVLLEEWDEFLESGEDGVQLPDPDPTGMAQIQYTSGTTGTPKGAMLAHRGIANNGRMGAMTIGMSEEDVWVNPMPMFHNSGCVVCTLGAASARGCQVLLPMFDPAVVLELVEQEQASGLGAVPTMLIAIMEHPDFEQRDLSSLRFVVTGGAKVPPSLIRRIEDRLGVDVVNMYGQTECSPILSMTRPRDSVEDKALTVGVPLPHTEVKIADPASGEVLARGDTGEICTRGYHVTEGYFEMPEATAEAIDSERWLHTGDLGTMDDRGYIRVEGRVKEMIIRGGENIYPREIEELLHDHDDVGDVAVIGLPSEKWGEEVAAVVRPAPGRSPSEEELFAYVRQHLAPYKTPKHWFFADELPMTPSGKVQKFELVKRYGESEE